MDPYSNKFCMICLEDLNNIDNILFSFTCHHNLCFKCIPYFILDIIKKVGIKKEIFEIQTEYSCITCPFGKTTIPFDIIARFLNQNTRETPDKETPHIKKNNNVNYNICEACEINEAKVSCLECNQDYCDFCLNTYHLNNRKFSKHRVVNMEQKHSILSDKINECKCPGKDQIDLFCLKCQSVCCRYCAKTVHYNHHIKPLTQVIPPQNKTKSYEQITNHFKILNDNFKKLQKNLLKTIESEIETNNKEFNKYDSLHPNKKYQIYKDFRDSKNLSEVISKDFSIKIVGNEKIKKIKNDLTDFYNDQIDKNLLNYFENDGFLIIDKSETYNKINQFSFYSDPIELLAKNPFLLDKGTFDFGFCKSNVSTSFIIDDETFLVWTGSIDEKGKYYPLYIYNLSQRKKNQIIAKNNSYINVLSTYPNNANYDSKKWLYSGDNSGVFSIYEISKDKSFRELNKIRIESGVGILSAVIFDDKFGELSNDKDEVFALISLALEDAPLVIYKINTNEIIKKIENPTKAFCRMINFFYDDNLLKTLIFCGFSRSQIKLYDLKLENWDKKSFETKEHVTSMNFVFEDDEKFLIYTQGNNSIVVANIEQGKVLRGVGLKNTEYIYDLCIWNTPDQIYLIIATYNQNSIKILNFDNLNILCSKETANFRPINILKVLLRESENRKFKEGLVSFHTFGDSPIMIHI